MLKLKRIAEPAAIILILLASTPLRSEIELVRNGVPRAEIVVDENALAEFASVRLAVDDLRQHIETMSGARLDVVHNPSGNHANLVYVGPGSHLDALRLGTDELMVGGFKVIARENYVALFGHDEKREPPPYANRPAERQKAWQEFAGEKYSFPGSSQTFNTELGIFHDESTATLYAVAEFLEQLGVRWYFPYEDGTVIPERETIIVPEQALTREPEVPYRFFNYYGAMRTDAAGVLWFKRLKYGVPYGMMYGHTTGDVLGWGAQREDHPEYFAMRDGKPLGNVPRLSDPGFRRSAVNFLDKYIRAWPWMKYVNMAPTDGFVRIDERDAHWNRPERGHAGRLSDYVWDFWLHVADELKSMHPDRYLRCNSYAPYALPPTTVEKLPDNVAICIAVNTATSFRNQEHHDRIRDQWVEMITSGKLFVYDFYLFYRPHSPRYPVVFTEHLQREMRALRDTGMFEGKFTEIWAKPGVKLGSPGLTHLLHYWQGRLYWDIDKDREAMLGEYYNLYFGPAREAMREYYEHAEAAWMRPESRTISRDGGFLRKADVERFFDLLARAREKAGEGSVYDRRIARIEMEMQPLKTQFDNLNRTGPFLNVFRPAIYKIALDELDGDLDKPFWREHRFWNWYPMRDSITAKIPENNRTSVSFRSITDRNREALVIGAVCHESDMSALVSRTVAPGDPAIFDDDIIEIYLATPERSFFRIVVNAAGVVWSESHDPEIVERDTLPELWNPGIEAAVARLNDRWTVEVRIPTADFGALGPSQNFPWGINVGRRRRAGGVDEWFAVAPTGKLDFSVLQAMGDLAAGDYSGSRYRDATPPGGWKR